MDSITKAMIRRRAMENAILTRPIKKVTVYYRDKNADPDTIHNVVGVISQPGTASILYREETASGWRFVSEVIPFDTIKYIEVVRDGADLDEDELKAFEAAAGGAGADDDR